MIWTTWRQFRVQAYVALGVLAVLGIVLVITQRDLAHLFTSSGLGTCGDSCQSQAQTFMTEFAIRFPSVVYDVAVGVMYLTPALVGVFWGAPLMARELETGTYRLAWNQSVTRRRWMLTKLAGIGLASMAVTGLLSLGVTWALSYVDQFGAGELGEERIGPLLFGARGIAPIGYAAFAFALGVTAGMVIRRTVPAMAATLALYAAAVAAMPQWVRAHLAPLRHATPLLDVEKIHRIAISGPTGQLTVLADADVPGAWVLSNSTVTADGQPFTGPVNPAFCGPEAARGACVRWLGSLNLHQDLLYHSADQYWTLQWAETGLFLGLAVLLAGFCLWRIRRV